MIEFDNLSLSFGDNPVLRDIDVAIAGPGLTVIFGESGQGKSTLLKLATGQIPISRAKGAARIAGEVRIAGRRLQDWRPHELSRTIGLCLQDVRMLPGSVGDNLIGPHRMVLPRLSAEARRAHAEEALGHVGLAQDVTLDRPAHDLSGGQMQRLSLARAIMLAPQAIFLDEPTSALDGVAGAKVVESVLALSKTRPTVVVTHDERIARLSGRVLFLGRPAAGAEGAEILADGPPEHVFGPRMRPELARIVTAFDGVGRG